MKTHYQILIVGGGTAGLTVAARLRRANKKLDIGLIDPSEFHYYQPLWTLVGGGVFKKAVTRRKEADYMPKGVTWIKEAVTHVDAENNQVQVASGTDYTYDYLVLCPGIQLDWHLIPGLKESLGSNGVCSNYGYDKSAYTWEVLRKLKGGKALFTQPSTPIKCGGAPQKIMYLTGDYLRKNGLLDKTDIQFFSHGEVIFGVKEFVPALKKAIARYGITFNLKTELIEVRGDKKEAVFRVTAEDGTTSERVESFDMLHVVPPQSAPDFIKSSSVAREDGWIDISAATLQHNRFENVFALGDAGGTPNAKTGAAVRKQAPIVVYNLLQVMANGASAKQNTYNGYSSCPLVTGYGKLVLAEFDYDNNPDPSFPFDTTKERLSMYYMKIYLLPLLYWQGMLKGRA